MFLLELVIDHNSRTFSFIDDLKAEREAVWHCMNFVDGRITFKPNFFWENDEQFEPFLEIFFGNTIQSVAYPDWGYNGL